MKKQFNFDYNGNNISFELENFGIMVNATEMAKTFSNKKISEWKRLPSTQNYLQSIIDTGRSLVNMIVTKKSGISGTRGGGSTWMHEWITLEYSKWLGGDMYFWLVGRLKEIHMMRSGENIILGCDREELVDFSLDLIDMVGEDELVRKFEVLGGYEKILPSIENELGDLVFYFSTPPRKTVRMKKEDILMSVVEVGNNEFTLKVIDYLDNFIDSSSHTYLSCKYYVLGNILGNMSSSGNNLKNQKTYLMKDSNTGYTKIGKAIDPKFRERTLQSQKPTISLFAVCDLLVESELHNKYGNKRVRGEWFELGKKDVEDILRTYKFNVA